MIYDISPPLSPDLAVWPGDTPLTRQVLADLERGDPTTLSSLHATAHLGAHADAPSHYDRDGRSIDEQPIELYIGSCQVLHVQPSPGERVTAGTPGMIERPFTEPRVLFATGTCPDPTSFNRELAGLSADLIDELHRQGVRLLGIDTPSVDPPGDDKLTAHRRCMAHDIAILEGLYLAEVPDGVYELIALPLKLVGFDASPVRAILRPPR